MTTTESSTRAGADWAHWLDRWDRQQTAYLPLREARFEVMFQAVERLRGREVTILDLACGPASLSQRFLTRNPAARSIGVDMDPVLLELGRRNLGDQDGRLTLRRADLTDPGWTDLLAGERIDAVLTTTALHWLAADQLVRLYRQLADLLPEGAVFLDGDHMAYDVAEPTLQHLALMMKAEREQVFERDGDEDYAQWWTALEAYSERLDERERLPFAERRDVLRERRVDTRRAGIAMHITALRDAGFAEAGQIWGYFENRVIMGVR
ncbi:trans-aconitate 2-methyltransferase [Nocardioides sp. DS6]|uniref:Trans-aconitate 2-methyltransferase n=1 Tax=Nocardioides eburneus TaxID=3231482 RepID=A0ABV3SVL6_9ACTN